ncbi:hypothetical protein Hanom_Chr08g00749721 [Helianthus anomalus]
MVVVRGGLQQPDREKGQGREKIDEREKGGIGVVRRQQRRGDGRRRTDAGYGSGNGVERERNMGGFQSSSFKKWVWGLAFSKEREKIFYK